MNMIEKVARALCNAEGVDPDRKGNDREFRWQEYERDARAAVEAMREPTEGMLDAGDKSGYSCSEGVHISHLIGYEGLRIIFTTMLDAALQENQP